MVIAICSISVFVLTCELRR